MNRCPNETELREYITEKLPSEIASQIEGHVETCVNCQAVLARLSHSSLGKDQRQQLRAILTGSASSLPPVIPGIELIAIVGEGAIGQVWKARQTDLGRLVAIKMLRTEIDDESASIIRNEAEVLARLDHPNVVRIFQSGPTTDGYFFAMEYLSSGSLADERSRSKTPWDVKDAARLIRDVARAVQAAHDCNILHRDIKPGNILIAPDRTPKIADFGQAATFGHRLRDSGEPVGTPCYMAPEQTGNGTVDAKTDVYGLGGVLYDVLTGRSPIPHEGEREEILRRVRNDDPIPPRILRPGIPRDLETIVLKCLEKEPARRYSSARELAEDLDRFLDGKPVRARPLGFWGSAFRQAKRHPHLAALSLGFVLFALVSFVTLAVLYRRAEANAELANRRLKTAHMALLTVARTREQQFWFPQNIRLQDPAPIVKLFELHEAALADFPDDPEARYDFAYAMMQLSKMLAMMPKPEGATSMMERGRNALRELVAAYPDVPKYRLGYAEANMQLSGYLSGPGASERIRTLRLESLEIAKALVEAHPGNGHYTNMYATFLHGVGKTALEDREFGLADRYLSESVRRNRIAAKRYPDDAYRHFYLAAALKNYSLLLLQHFPDPDRYLALQNEIIAVQTEARKCDPARTAQYQEFYDAYLQLAYVYESQGEAKKSQEASQRGHDLIRIVERENPDDERIIAYRLTVLYQEAFRLLASDPKESRKRFAELHEQIATYRKRMPANERIQTWECYALLANAEFRHAVKAVALAKELAQRPSPIERMMYGHALCENGEYAESIVEFDRLLADLKPEAGTNHMPFLTRTKARWQNGEKDRARTEFHILSPIILADFTATFEEVYRHDALWKLIEGTPTPKRGGPPLKPVEVPLLFR